MRLLARLMGFGGDRARGLHLVEEAARYPSSVQSNALFTLVLLYNREARYDDWPGGKSVYRGTGEVLDGFAHYLAGIKGFHTSGHEVIRVDHQRVLGLHNEHRVGEDDRPVVLEIGVVYLFADGQVVRADVYTGHAKARRVIGL